MTVARILDRKGRSVVTTMPHASLQDIAQELTQNGIGALVVVNSSGNIEGIISERDIVTAVANYGALALSDAAMRYMTPQPPIIEETELGRCRDGAHDSSAPQTFAGCQRRTLGGARLDWRRGETSHRDDRI